jgi:hypothetical protein
MSRLGAGSPSLLFNERLRRALGHGYQWITDYRKMVSGHSLDNTLIFRVCYVAPLQGAISEGHSAQSGARFQRACPGVLCNSPRG